MPRHLALLRGINVGRAKRIRMEELRQAFTDLGYTEIRTLLNSGNVIFTSSRRLAANAAVRLEETVRDRTGVSARMILLTEAEVRTIWADRLLLKLANDPTRLLVAVPSTPADIVKLQKLVRNDWEPEALAVGGRAAYLWCPEGLIASPVFKAVDRELLDEVTTRNWSTLTKLVAAMGIS